MEINNDVLSAGRFIRLKLAVWWVLPTMLGLSACGGGDGEGEVGGDENPPVISEPEYHAVISDLNVQAVSNSTHQVRFAIESNSISDATLLDCDWKPSLEASAASITRFDCSIGTGNQVDFDAGSPGEYEGEVSVTLPDGSTVHSSVDYVVAERSEDTHLVDASDQFDDEVNSDYYLFKKGGDPHTLWYFPKHLSLTANPGIASVQLSNKLNWVQEIVLQPSETDWASQEQLTFSSRYSLEHDTQALQSQAQSAGFTEIVELKVKPPSMAYEQRYTTDIPQERITVTCDNLVQDVNGRLITLLDCYVVDTNNPQVKSPINLVQSVVYEPVEFDPDTLTSQASIRGNFTVDYSLPGTHVFNSLVATGNADLSSTFQVHFHWPLLKEESASATASFRWEPIIAGVQALAADNQTTWSQQAIEDYVQRLLEEKNIVLPEDHDGVSNGLFTSLVDNVKQELFVAIVSSKNLSQVLFWAPKLRFGDIRRIPEEERTVRYLNSTMEIKTQLDLSCIGQPDAQNNIVRSPACW